MEAELLAEDGDLGDYGALLGLEEEGLERVLGLERIGVGGLGLGLLDLGKGGKEIGVSDGIEGLLGCGENSEGKPFI